MPYEILTSEAVNQFIFESNIRAVISLFFGFLSVFIIIRYTTNSMKEYKFHLLNMAISILFCDLSLTILSRSYPTMPLPGGCLIGELRRIVPKSMSVDSLFYIMMGLIMFSLLSNMGAVCNATFYRYVFVSSLVDQNTKKLSNLYIYGFMFFIQVLWPFVSTIICIGIELRPNQALEKYENLYPDILKRMDNQPCIFLWIDLKAVFAMYSPIILGILNWYCSCSGSILILVMCWRKILNVKIGKLSQRTITMQKKLIITLGFQTILPVIAYLFGVLIMGIGLLSGIQFTEYFVNHMLQYVAFHSVLNFMIMFVTIPTYQKGLIKDLKYLLPFFGYKNEPVRVTSLSNVQTVVTSPSVRRVFAFK